jgi:hypothetical protein
MQYFEGELKRQSRHNVPDVNERRGDLRVCSRHDRHCQVASVKKELPFIHYQFSVGISDSTARFYVITAVLLNVESVVGMLRCVVG